MLSLYRRHRPRTFDSVVGQEHIVRTLRNAIELDKVHHAYLFVGSRGTGKTSMAKLLACALNAEGGPRVEFDPASPTAAAILSGTSLDVVEMDAASNNSVDDIRELRENVALAPMQGGKRVYILDEAHMLSTAAWNAFLKTLEEPPAHVVFVLATTEAHKVPATIVDRCHRFDFRRPGLEQIAGVLKRVAAEEGIEIPDPAVGMLARAATGSFRDALGTLEQLVTYGGPQVKLEDVLDILGVAEAELVLEVGEALAGRDPKAALIAVQRLSDSGRDFTQFMRDLSGHLRHLFVVQTLGQVPDSFSVTAEHTDRLASQAERISQGEILRAIDFLAAALAAVKDGSEPRLQLEMALLKATQPQADLSLQALMFRIEQIEARLEGREERPAQPAAASSSSPAAGSSSSPAAAPRQSSVGAATAVAVESRPREESQPVGAVELERLVALWPAVAETVAAENPMLGAGLEAARPVGVEGDRLTIAFPADAAFVRKKAEASRELVAGAVRGLTGYAVGLAFQLSDDPIPAGEATLDHERLIERLREEFGAEELFDEPDEEKR
ncbi:MAG TPA: DNA polymerase III subunit gamma/tau [Thermoleophilaceae bacterium]|nr:DNA polymerase III subunit gamma/tau [Thermoleophilaceae bacterium]